MRGGHAESPGDRFRRCRRRKCEQGVKRFSLRQEKLRSRKVMAQEEARAICLPRCEEQYVKKGKLAHQRRAYVGGLEEEG